MIHWMARRPGRAGRSARSVWPVRAGWPRRAPCRPPRSPSWPGPRSRTRSPRRPCSGSSARVILIRGPTRRDAARARPEARRAGVTRPTRWVSWPARAAAWRGSRPSARHRRRSGEGCSRACRRRCGSPPRTRAGPRAASSRAMTGPRGNGPIRSGCCPPCRPCARPIRPRRNARGSGCISPRSSSNSSRIGLPERWWSTSAIASHLDSRCLAGCL